LAALRSHPMGLSGLLSVAGLPWLASCLMFIVLVRLARSRTAAGIEAAAGMAAAVGLVVGLLGATRVLRWAPPQWLGGSSWLPWVAVLATVCMAGLASPAWPPAVARGFPWGWAVLASGVALFPISEPGLVRGLVVVASTVIAGGLWSRARSESTGPLVAWRGAGWVLTGCAAAASLALSGQRTQGVLVLLGVATFAGTLLGGRWLGQSPATRGALPAFCLLVPPALLTGALLQGTPLGWCAAALQVAALGLAGAPERTAAAGPRGPGLGWARLGSVLLLALGGLSLAWWGQT
jgi:hypothetical protein